MSLTPLSELPSVAGLLSNPDLTAEQRDVYVAMSEGSVSPDEAIRRVMELESARNLTPTAPAASLGGDEL